MCGVGGCCGQVFRALRCLCRFCFIGSRISENALLAGSGQALHGLLCECEKHSVSSECGRDNNTRLLVEGAYKLRVFTKISRSDAPPRVNISSGIKGVDQLGTTES